MSGAVLADTGPLYALADPSDQYHDRAHRELETIASRNNPVLVVFPVLCETHTLVLRRLGGKYAAGWLEEILSGSVPVNPEAKDYLEASADVRKYSDHPITLVDALLARLTRRLQAPVWSFDRHFVTMRANVWRPTVN
jgi:predicted nucleic acid-binding protein